MRSRFREADYKLYTWMVLSLCLTLLALSLSACGKAAPTESSNVYSFETPKQLANAVKNFKVTCEGPCIESAGVLLAIDTKNLEIRTCSFSLVAKDIIVTNGHCLPDNLAKAGAACEGKIQALFAKDGEKEVFACDKVISISEPSKNQNEYPLDYAFLKLSTPTIRKPLSFNTSGLTHQEPLTALIATPIKQSSGIGSKLERVVCTTHMNSFVVPSFTGPLSPVVAFKGCKIVQGNSGASMVNAAGEIKAILQAAPNWNEDVSAPKTLSEQLASVQQTMKVSIGTNAACMDEAVVDLSSARSGCNKTPELYNPTFASAGLDEDKESEIQNAFLQALERRTPDLKFKLRIAKPSSAEMSAGMLSRVIAEPACIRKVKKEFRYETQVFIYTQYVDEDARLKVRTRVEIEKVTLTLQKPKLNQMNASPSEIFEVSEVSQSSKRPLAGVKRNSYSLEGCAQ